MAGPRGPWSEERKAAWRARMAERNSKPASGIPASGPGWGGGAKGAGDGSDKAPSYTPETSIEASKLPRDYTRVARQEELFGFWTSVVFDENESTLYRISAAEKLHDRKYSPKDGGKPDNGQIVIIGGLPDDD